MTKLDDLALSIELVLISLIESVALTFLAEHSIPALESPDAIKFVPYIIGGLAIILVFWAQSILHAISFIRWPIRVSHMFLYFVAAFLQILAYSTLGNLQMWFLWWTIFTGVGLIMYMVDLWIIKETRAQTTDATWQEFLAEVERRHIYEMRFLVPAALVFNLAALITVSVAPQLFESPLAYAIPGILQVLVTAGAIYDCVKNFRSRSAMIKEVFEK